jgi:hypothetical protein
MALEHPVVEDWPAVQRNFEGQEERLKDAEQQLDELGSQLHDETLELLESATAPAPVPNAVVLYAEDNGSGKTRLMARFGTGAAQQVAIEP